MTTTHSQRNTSHGLLQTIALPSRNFGSLADREIESLRTQLQSLCKIVEAPYLVIDMSAVPKAGAAFLSVLIYTNRQLRTRGKRLIVVGDRHGIFAATKLDRIIPTFESMDDAVEFCLFTPTIETIGADLTQRQP